MYEERKITAKEAAEECGISEEEFLQKAEEYKKSPKVKTPFEALKITWVRVIIKVPKEVHSLLLSLLFRKREREKERERKRKRERIKQLRKKKDISQSELALLIGVKKNTVSTWKRGTRKTDFNALQLLSDYFEVSFECLLTHVDD